ncbi:MAG: ATP-binding protein [Myxococcota bacterium]
MSEQEEVDLTECDREPIHVPGAIQPHGVLLSLREPELVIVQVSDNAQAVLGHGPAELLERPLGDVLEESSVDVVRRASASERPREHNPLPVRGEGRSYDGILHRHLGATILELEPAADPPTSSTVPSALRSALAHIQAADAFDDLLQVAVEQVQRLTGFERVLCYRFDAAGHGEVVAEVHAPDQSPYLGLRYPASDIPRQARELYRMNPMRLIPDAVYEPAQIVPPLRPDTKQPLDMSFSVLRSVSPIHREYMGNMGVRASMSLSLLQRGELWGLIGCLDRQPRHVRYGVRADCEVVARVVSLQITALEQMEHQRRTAERGVHMEALVAAMHTPPAEVLASLAPQGNALLALVGAQGAAICAEGAVHVIGDAPPRDAIERIRRLVGDRYDRGLFCSESLPSLLPELRAHRDVAAGLLAIRLPRTDDQEVLWFRPEVTRTVRWGGDPNKPATADASGRLHPRRSFELWKEQVRLTSLPWHPVDLELAADLRRRAVEIDLQRQVRRARRAVRARDDLISVVSHDLRDPLSVLKMQAPLLDEEATSRRTDSASSAGQLIGRSVARMERLLDDLMDAARIDAGRLSVEPQPLDLGRVVALALEGLRPRCAAKGVDVAAEVPGGLRVFADEHRFYQVLSNLVGNALRHTTAGGRIRVRAEPADDAVQLTVADTGAGIDPEHQHHLFERYWQSGAERGSAGLGLFICRGIVEAHGGRIWVESQIGEGTCFHFTLPRPPAPGGP